MNNEEMRKMWETAANESYLPTKHKPLTDKDRASIRDQANRAWEKESSPEPIDQGNIIYDGARERGGLPPRKPWTPGDEDRRKPRDKYGDKYGDKRPSPRPSKKPNTRPDTPPSMMHDKEAIKGYPSVKPPINNIGNNIGKSDSINHENNKSYKPQNPKP